MLRREIIEAHANGVPLGGGVVVRFADARGWRWVVAGIAAGGSRDFSKPRRICSTKKAGNIGRRARTSAFPCIPNDYRTANTIYCAFPRLFGPTKNSVSTQNPKLEAQIQQIEQFGYAIIPPSGKLRDLVQCLPHIIDVLGCRILHLLPVHPTPTTYARFGRFGSPYAALDLTAVDPALVEFDKRTTGIDQFCELTYATHLRGGRVFIDIVINHTGWGSTLQENHPEWFLRKPDGEFASPGAWGTVWEDLVELNTSTPCSGMNSPKCF